MTNKIKGVAAAMAAVAALAIGGAAIAGAAGSSSTPSQQPPANAATQSGATAENQEANEGPDQPIGGTALDQASAAALQRTGGGQVTDTEVGDEESYYEVEVSRDDGTQVDVQLDRSFNVVGGEIDEE
ncbi:MAG: PepSY domain-containing protein [Actinomycetota bacterium]